MIMNNIMQNNPEVILALLPLAFLGIIIDYYIIVGTQNIPNNTAPFEDVLKAFLLSPNSQMEWFYQHFPGVNLYPYIINQQYAVDPSVLAKFLLHNQGLPADPNLINMCINYLNTFPYLINAMPNELQSAITHYVLYSGIPFEVFQNTAYWAIHLQFILVP